MRALGDLLRQSGPRLAFERWARFIVEHAHAAVLASAVLLALLTAPLVMLEFDGSSEAFLASDDPARLSHDRFRKQFGRDHIMVLAIVPPYVFDRTFLERLGEFHADLERSTPHLRSVTSLINARFTRGSDSELIVGELVSKVPESEPEMSELRDRVFSSPLYLNQFISRDGSVTAVTVELNAYSSAREAGPAENESDLLENFDRGPAEHATPTPLSGSELGEAVRAVRAAISRHETPEFRVFAAGGPIGRERVQQTTQTDIIKIVVGSNLAIGLLLFLLFRRVSGVLLPQVIVLPSVVATVGCMAATGVPITLPSQALPSFLIAIGLCDSVHLLSRFYRLLDQGVPRKDAIVSALGSCGLAIVLTSLTTAGGLVSFVTSDLSPIVHFGVFGPLGVLLALLFTLTLLPALLAILPLRRRDARADSTQNRMLQAGVRLAARRPALIIAASLTIAFVGFGGVFDLRISHHPVSWFPERDPTREAIEFYDRTFEGSVVLSVMLEGRSEGAFHDPELLSRLAELQAEIESESHGPIRVGKIVSLTDILKEINRALNENRIEEYRIPTDRELIAQEFLLFENSGSDDLEEAVDPSFRIASVLIRIGDADAVELAPFIDDLEQRFREALGDRVGVTFTGPAVMNARTFDAVLPSMAASYVVALLAVTPFLIILLGSFKMGLLAMVPNLLPIALTLGLMGWVGFSIDIATMMVAATVLGIVVDDTIHLSHAFRVNYEQSGERERSLLEAIHVVGPALVTTSLVLSVSFLFDALASMQNIAASGILRSFAIATALAADLLLLPALLVLSVPERTPLPQPVEAPPGRSRRAG